MDERRIPGLTVAVVDRSGRASIAAYGTAVLQHGVPARVETVYELASLTKQFTAACLLLLQEDGRLALDDRLGTHLDDLPEAWRRVSLRQALTHTSGLAPQDREFASLKGAWRRFMPSDVMLDAARDDPMGGEPGERFDYSNVGYFLAALVVERASGMSYRTFLRTRIFEPLGMRSTLVHDELAITPHEAQGYALKDGELVNIWRDCVEEVAGGWGMFSSVPDLVRWDAALRSDSLLSRSSLEEMFSPAQLRDGTTVRYGLGWWLPERNGIPYQYHNGITGTEMLRIPAHGWTIIVLTNLGKAPAIAATEAEPWGLADAIAGALVPAFELRTLDEPVPVALLDEVAGLWRFGYGDARFFARDGALWIDDDGGTDRMLYQGRDTFGFDGDPERLVFERDDIGRVSGARWVAETWQDDPGKRLAPGDR